VDVARFRNSPVGSLIPIRGTDGRSGREYDHSAFLPDALDAEPALTSETWRAVSRANRALGRLHQAGRQVPAPALLRRPTLRREAQSTSALEGTFAPLEDVLAAGAESADPAASADLLEVLNYVYAAEDAFEWLSEGRPLTVSLLEDLQGRLVAGTGADTGQAGHVRAIQVAIGSPDGGIESARFVPPPPGPALEAGLRDLLTWITEDEPRDAVVAAAQAHYQFETLHPFNDGNGRIGRLLVVLQLLHDDVLDEPLLSISPWFEQRRREYQDHLLEVSRTGDWDAWVRFFARGLEASATDTAHRVDALLRLQEQYLSLVRASATQGVVRDIAESLIAYPYLDVPATVRRTGRTSQAILTAMNKLLELGVLAERPPAGRRRRFVALDVVRVLSAPPTD
jgi:Fic family protein